MLIICLQFELDSVFLVVPFQLRYSMINFDKNVLKKLLG